MERFFSKYPLKGRKNYQVLFLARIFPSNKQLFTVFLWAVAFGANEGKFIFLSFPFGTIKLH